MQTVHLGLHVAHLDPLTGNGLLVLPRTDDDVYVGTSSLHGADWDAATALDLLGWEPAESDDGCLYVEGHTQDGQVVVGLFGRDPITSNPDLNECGSAFDALAEIAGLHRSSPI